MKVQVRKDALGCGPSIHGRIFKVIRVHSGGGFYVLIDGQEALLFRHEVDIV